MVKPAGCGSQPSVSQAAVFFTDSWGPPLVGPADRPGTRASALVRRERVLPAADYCSRASNDAGLVSGHGNSAAACRAITVAIPLSRLVNGLWGPWEGPADSWGPTSNGPSRGDLAVFGIPADW